MIEEQYDITGMHCAACSSSVERVTRKLPGVKESNVNLPLNRLTILYDENETTSQDIINKIKKAGFSASLRKEEKTEESVEEKSSLKSEKNSLTASLCFSAVLLFISMGQMLFPQMPVPDIISMHTHPMNFALIQLLVSLPVLILGKKFFISGFRSIFYLNPNMDSLVALSSTASLIYSIVMTFRITDNPDAVHNLYYESAAVVVALVSVGKYLEEKNKEKTKGAISALMSLAPETAILVDENGQWEVPVEMIKEGDTILVKHGAEIPLDGIVIEGSANADEAMLTGESNPVEKQEGSEVIGGSILLDGAIFVKVTRTGENTTLAKIIKFVEDAQNKKAPIARVADKVAGFFVPLLIGIGLLAGIIWFAVTKNFSFAIKIFTSVLVIGCPCAMGLATPTAIIVGTGLGASKGILIKNGEALETTHKAEVVIFDKTGTVTEGRMSVTDTVGENKEKILKIAYSLEKLSDHPISKAICTYAEEKGTSSSDVSDFRSIAGYGICAKDENKKSIFAGNARLMAENNIDISCYEKDISALQEKGKTLIFVAEENKLLGIIAVADTVKKNVNKTVEKLKKMGLHTVLLTGDNKKAAKYIGEATGCDEIIAEVLPTDKAEVVKKFQQENKTVIMVGDGINDAPALTQADIGCAVGSGSFVAVESAEIVLMKDDPEDVVKAIRLSRLTISNIRQNLFWAFCYNTLAIPVAAGVLYPAFGLLLSPMIGAIAMSLSSLFVVSNALRLKTFKL
ncbi:MAG: copper-translocating P-type ATPase [Ruminococcaceae bacterium]|nr:copper-translocating P-type ATPase [Oscillospiraceae bacterium]